MILFRDEVLNQEIQEELEEINERAELGENVSEIVADEKVEEKPVQEIVEKPVEEPVVEPVQEKEPDTPLEKEVNSLLKELEELERALGMPMTNEDFPELKPIILPTFNMPVEQIKSSEGVAAQLTRADIAKLNDEQFEALMGKLRHVEHLEAQVEAMKNIIDSRLSVDFRAMYENLLEKSNIEAIKTYRNVQAVIIEENAKQNQALLGLDNKSNSLKRRMNNVLLFAVVSFVVSILVMLMQILPALGVDLF